MARKTQQRAAIRQVFSSAKRPLSAPEVLGSAQKIVAGIGIATVYRNIKSLVDDGWINVVELPGDPNRYEVSRRTRNVYFRCTKTNRVFSFDLALPDISNLLPGSFQGDRVTIIIDGKHS